MSEARSDDVLVSVRDLRTHFFDKRWWFESLLGREAEAVRAVDGVDLDIRRGETLGIVGESGSGKTTLGKAILRLAPVTAGRVLFEGEDITQLTGSSLRRLRPRMQMIFQDPYSSLSPRLSVSSLLTEPYRINDVPREDRHSVEELLETVELSPELAPKFPHELSGGQARRVGIARALALNPAFLVADEPTAGLDVSAGAKILNLLRDLATRLGLTYLVVTHNLAIVDYIADRLAVMYLGKLFETGPTERVLDAPAHPYTYALLSSISEPDPRRRRERVDAVPPGEIPSPRNPPAGCRFHPRCPYAEERSRNEVPTLEEVEAGHLVACHFWEKVRAAEASGQAVTGVQA